MTAGKRQRRRGTEKAVALRDNRTNPEKISHLVLWGGDRRIFFRKIGINFFWV